MKFSKLFPNILHNLIRIILLSIILLFIFLIVNAEQQQQQHQQQQPPNETASLANAVAQNDSEKYSSKNSSQTINLNDATVNHSSTMKITDDNNNNNHNNFGAKIRTLIKILQFINNVAALTTTARELSLVQQQAQQNDTESETRSMSSWLGLKAKESKLKSNRRSNHHDHSHDSLIDHHHHQPHHHHHHLPHQPIIVPNIDHPAFIPISQSTSTNDHNPHYDQNELFNTLSPILSLQSLSDTNSIEYWLKMLEDPKFEERIMPIIWNGRNDYNYFDQMKDGFDFDDKKSSISSFDNDGRWVGKKNRKIKLNSRNSEHHLHRHYYHQQQQQIEKKKNFNRLINNNNHMNGNNMIVDDGDEWSSMPNDIENESINGFVDKNSRINLNTNIHQFNTGQMMKKIKYPYTNQNINSINNNYKQQPQQQSPFSNHHHHQQQQQQFDISPRCDKFTEDICIDDFEYPEHAILDEIFKRKDIFQLMYAEVNGDISLVDGITKDMDENFSQDYYYNNNDPLDPDDDYHDDDNHFAGSPPLSINRHDSNKSSTTSFEYGESMNNHQNNNNNNNQKQINEQGFVCRSEVLYAKPKLAKNLKRKWRVIVNAGDFTQTIRLEKCNKANSECRYIADHKYASRCTQIYSIHRLLVFEKGKGFFIDSFRIPTACTCHVYSLKPSYNQNNINLQQNNNKKLSSESIMNNLQMKHTSTTSPNPPTNYNNNENTIQNQNHQSTDGKSWPIMPNNGVGNNINNNNGNLKNNNIINLTTPYSSSKSDHRQFNTNSINNIYNQDEQQMRNLQQQQQQQQQQYQQTLLLLNNQELLKLLSLIDSQRHQQQNNGQNNEFLLQKLIENLTSSSNSQSNNDYVLQSSKKNDDYDFNDYYHFNNNNNNNRSENNNRIRFTPEYRFNFTDIQTDYNRRSPSNNFLPNEIMSTKTNQLNMRDYQPINGHHIHHNHHQQQQQQLNNDNNNVPSSAPVVQVIHMPVTTSNIDQLPSAVSRLSQWPFNFDANQQQRNQNIDGNQRHTDTMTFLHTPSNNNNNYQNTQQQNHYLTLKSKYLALASDNNLQNSRNNNNSINLSELTTTSSSEEVKAETIAVTEDSTEQNNNDNDQNKDEKTSKMNFSYHPILDYIFN